MKKFGSDLVERAFGPLRVSRDVAGNHSLIGSKVVFG